MAVCIIDGMRHEFVTSISDIDPQDIAERVDEDVVDDVDDTTGDEYGDGLPDFPPELQLGVERDGRPEPSVDRHGTRRGVGQLVEPNASSPDEEAQLFGYLTGGEALTEEEAAMHLVDEP